MIEFGIMILCICLGMAAIFWAASQFDLTEKK